MPARKTKTIEKNVTLSNPAAAADPELAISAKRMLLQAQALTVANAGDYENAAAVLQGLTERESELEAKKKELWDPLAKLTKSVQSLFNPPLKVLEQAKNTIKSKMGVYALAQRNLQLAAQQRADEEAEEAREKLLAKAEKFQDSGNYERAHVLEDRAQNIVAPTIESETPKVAGVSLREHWLFEVTDVAKVPREYLMVDERLVRADVTGSKGTKQIPGIRIWSELRPQG